MTYWTNGVASLYWADAREIPLPDASVHCVVTSPPYWGQRDYGLGQWEGGAPDCDHRLREYIAASGLEGSAATANHQQDSWPGGVCGRCGAVHQQTGIGLEPTLAEHVGNIVEVLREVRRVLRPDGTVWLNYGDGYSSGNRATYRSGASDNKGHQVQDDQSRPATPAGLKPKDLLGLPWRIAFALQDDGWWLRSAIVWNKPNPMPESVQDRPSSAYEMVFLLTKRATYYYDADAIREPSKSSGRVVQPYNDEAKNNGHENRTTAGLTTGMTVGNYANARDVWTIATQPRAIKHFATFPDALPRRCILAGTSEHGVCADCGAPWERAKSKAEGGYTGKNWAHSDQSAVTGKTKSGGHREWNESRSPQTVGWRPTCECDAPVVPAVVLDPFVGSGTTAAVAQSLGRRAVGLDLNAQYLEIAKKRISAEPLPLGGMA